MGPRLRQLVACALVASAVSAGVALGALTKAGGVTFQATAGQEFGGRVATFSSNAKAEDPSFFDARIFWGDGTQSTGEVVLVAGGIETDWEVRGKHTYASGGTCEVTVQIKESTGDFREVKSTGNVSGPPGPGCSKEPPPAPPAAALKLPEGKRTGNPLVMYSESQPGSSAIVKWHWDFGDGQTAEAPAPGHANHIYDEPGTYTVTLTVTDAKGLTAAASGQITVRSTPQPVISFSPKKPRTTDDVHFSGQKSKVEGGKIVRWQWECRGQKTTLVDSNDVKSGSKFKARCKFGNAKSYSVKLTVTSDTGETASLFQSMPIKLKRPPIASFNWSPDHPEQDQTITFDASKSQSAPLGEGKGIESYRWELSDGTDETTTTPVFKHRFTGEPGSRTISLTVKDKEGKTTIERKLYVAGKCVSDATVRGVQFRSDCLRRRSACETGKPCWAGLPGAVVRMNGVELRPPAQAEIEIDDSGVVNAGVGDYAPQFDVLFGPFRVSKTSSFTIPGGGGPKTPAGDWAIDSGELHGLKFATDPLVLQPNGSSTIGANVRLPKPLEFVSGRVDIGASNDGGPFLGALHVEATDVPLPPFHLNKVTFDYSEANDTWAGSLSLASPSGTFGGNVAFAGGSIQQLGLFGQNLNIPFGKGVFLQSIGGSYTASPRQIAAEVGLSVGPSLAIPGLGAGALVDITGNWNLVYPAEGGWTTSIGGTARVLTVDTGAEFSATLSSAGRFDAQARFNTTLYEVFDVNGRLGLVYYDPGLWQAGAGIDICTRYIVHECATGELVISSVGIAACIRLPWGLPDVGGYYKWGGSVDFYFSGCSVGPVQIQIAGIRAAQSRSFTVKSGTASEVLAFEGRDGPPNVVLTGPNGERMETPADGYEMREPFFVSQEPGDRKTYVMISRPRAGKWTVGVAEGSTPVVRMQRAQGLPDPKIRARVTRLGAKRRLTWEATPIQGQRIVFSEQGAKGGGVIGRTTKARGSLTFTPSDGPKGKRTIVAEVLQSGNPRETLKVASYSAPRIAPPRPGALKLRRKGSSLVAAWGRSAGAKGYSVQVTLTDGRRIPIDTAKRSVTVPGLAKSEGATVSVAPYRTPGMFGPAAEARLRPAR
ncbi:MAG TPA: PKD domain-containing protein [Thermoleophilaceae bacterium]